VLIVRSRSQKVGCRARISAFVETGLKKITDCREKGETVEIVVVRVVMVPQRRQSIGRKPADRREVTISRVA